MLNEWKRCKKGDEFCPVSFKKYGPFFWIPFMLSGIAAIVINYIFHSPLLLALYAYPVVLLSLIRVKNSLFALLGVVLLGTLILTRAPDHTLLSVIAAYAVLMAIVRRVVWISIRNYNGKNEQEDLLLNTVFSLAKTIDARDPYTAYHSSNVADYAKSIAREMGLSEKEIDSIYLAGLIHDIGKISMPDSILQKEGRLTEEEYTIMKKHPDEGYRIIKDIKRLQELGITDMVLYHHERPDGKGYPKGLKGDAIPLGALILGVADAYDAMTTNRSYRQKLAVETAANELTRNIGTQFDPIAANTLIQILIREGKLQKEDKSVVTSPLSLAN
ncbi:HD-GYP domain-containing protein [Neobacillus sp. PS3-34]|uniref:HD-GYP domain-containing protein n=1 Tax=Neobacillus sp. PS3-34 TaxID=3070678 RepID=UPI0027E1AD87|nr:HD-GYP domain-containing protein [Neobacillus sp. PS3-34]WML48024.1 HD-GYP domain-containing protein [Neobacillus sp. PS3-34]